MTKQWLIRTATVAVGCGMLATACASDSQLNASDRARQQCFRPEQVSGFTAVDDRTVYVSTGPRRMFRLELLGTCPDVNWSWEIGIRARGSGWICSGLDADLIIPSRPGTGGPRRCPVTNISQLSDEEVQAFRNRSSRAGQIADEQNPGE